MITVFATKAAADTGLAGLSEGDLALVLADETRGGVRWYYRKVSGAYVSVGADLVADLLIANPPASTGGTFSNISAFKPVEIPPAAGSWTDSSGVDASAGAGWQYNVGWFAQGPVGRVNYPDATMNIGINFNQNRQNDNLSMPAVGIGFESLFANPGQPFATETHLRVVPKDTRSDIRWISNYGPELESDWPRWSNTTYRAASHSFSDGQGNPRIIFDMRPTVNQIQITRGTVEGTLRDAPQIAFQQNNRAPILLQKATGGSFVEPFRLSTGDRLLFNLPRTEQITASAGVVGGASVFLERQFLAPTAGSVGQFTTTQAITGAFTADSWLVNCTGLAHFPKRNTAAGGTVGMTMISNAGPSFFSFENSGAGSAGPQIRFDTAGDRLEIQANGYRGASATKAGMTIPRTTGQVQFAFPPKLPVSTVAALPAAATFGAGSQAYVTNLNSVVAGSIAAGGGTNKGVVVCDGTDWRIVAAWA